jgi:hypothetical protein
MKAVICILIISITTQIKVSASNYYVATTGNNSNSGLTTLTAWKTLTYAAGSSSPIVAGDTVFVKSGNYGAESVVFLKSGSSSNPISFIGYKTTPGDSPPLIVNNANPYSAFVSSDMPTFDGGNRANGTAFNCLNRKYLIIKNFQIQNYAYGLVAGGADQVSGNIALYNVNAMFIGDINSSYSGEGILFGNMGTKFSNNNMLENCLVVNSAAEGFGINGDHNTITGCKVYCNDNTNNNSSTDYYMILCGSYNTITNCYIERAPGLYHNGHGFSIKSNAEQVVDQNLSLPVINPQYNKISYCIARNMGESFCVRHRGVQNNLFYHCKAFGTHTGVSGSSGGEGNLIVTRDGASNNTFDGCIAEDCAAGFVFSDSVEDGDTGSNPTGHPGNNNKYINCLIYNCYIGVYYNSYSIASDAGDNTIANCTFYKTRYLHQASRHCANMKYIGNIYYGCLPNATGGFFKGSTYAADIVPNGASTYFKNCDFINIEGGMPANFVSNSAGSISADPVFKNPTASDFHLKSTSPCINTSITLPYVLTDYDSISRPQGTGYDMGAYEFFNIITATGNLVNESPDIHVFPNPTNGEFSITVDENLFMIKKINVEIYNLLGENIYSTQISSDKTKIDLNTQPKGVYIYCFKSERGIIKKGKIIKE